ncbi:MAG: hypothetical protein KDC47_05925 [Flavobacteriaceae bacterium]|nr:hypothetical protein [Flavobacteriaceae bacterium]
MTNGTKVTRMQISNCPVHGNDAMREYMQGRSFINQYTCGCATKLHGSAGPLLYTYHTSLNEAQKARRQV